MPYKPRVASSSLASATKNTRLQNGYFLLYFNHKMKVYMKKQKQKTTPNVIDVSNMSGTQIRVLINKLQAKLIDIENESYYDKVISKYKEKYEGKWVMLSGSDRYTYDGDNGYRLVKVRKVINVYHQDDAKKYEFDVSYDCIIRLNLPKQANSEYSYTEIGVTESGKKSNERITISELNEHPKIVSEVRIQEIREKARLTLIEKLNLLG